MSKEHEDHKLEGDDFDPTCEVCLFQSLKSNNISDRWWARSKPKVNNRGLIQLKARCHDVAKLAD